MGNKGGWSEKIQGLFGEYTQHYDADGNKTGYSEEIDGFTGRYTQHYDQASNKQGYSEDTPGLLGDYTQHYNQSHEKRGYSEEVPGLLDDYTQHYDQQGNQQGYSERIAGFFGRYTQHYHQHGGDVSASAESYSADGSYSSSEGGASYNISADTSGRPRNAVAILGLAILFSVVYLSFQAPRSGVSHSRVPDAQLWTNSLPLTLRGMGPIRIGMTAQQAENAVGERLAPIPNRSADTDCYYIRAPQGAEGIGFMVRKGTIARIDIWGPSFVSRSGIRVGDTEARVRDTYGNLLTIEGHKYDEHGHYLIVTPKDAQDSQYRMLFETDGSVVTTFRAGRLPEVRFVEGCA